MDPETKKKLPRIFFFLAAVVLLVKLHREGQENLVMNQVTGRTMGTISYSVKYRLEEQKDLSVEVDSLLKYFNESLSTYIPDSEISEFNQRDTLAFRSQLFFPVLETSQLVFTATNGAFDPTIGPLVNAWGFGPGQGINPTDNQIDSLLNFVGFNKVAFNKQYVTKPQGTYLDFSAVAKGYAVDLVGKLLEENNCKNYMVEIGGEVRTLGSNDKNEDWSIGIEDPVVSKEEKKIMAIAKMKNRSVATSGNYRNYFEKEGKLFAHIIDPRTGYTSEDPILSASVFTTDCMTADAYATAFMVMGFEQAKEFIDSKKELDAILVYTEGEEIKKYVSKGIEADISML